MPPAVVPFIPLIAAGVGAAGGVAGSLISSRKKMKDSMSPLQDKPKTNALAAEPDRPKIGVIPGTGSLGDTTNPSLNRNRLLSAS